MVVDHSERRLITGGLPVIGTYRLLRLDIAEKHGGFYSAKEFDISSLLRRHPGLQFLELGRSCVLPPYRTKRTIELLWHGVWKYVRQHNLDVMIGCASFEGTDTARFGTPAVVSTSLRSCTGTLERSRTFVAAGRNESDGERGHRHQGRMA
jgi:putative hemolysin